MQEGADFFLRAVRTVKDMLFAECDDKLLIYHRLHLQESNYFGEIN